MLTAVDVSRFIRQHHVPSGEVQLHKLVFYCQAWHLAWEGRPLFDDPIEAWPKGPVTRAVRADYKNFPDQAPNVTVEPDDAERATILAVLAYYGDKYGARLSELTHTEEPWKEAREGLGENEPSNRAISLETLRRFHTKRAIKGDGPKRAVVPPRSVDDETVLAVAGRQAQRWRETLKILADR